MSLITLAGVSVRLGGDTILSDVSVTFGRGERWGIVGRNGAGKTTLFRLITGQLQPAAGSVSRLPGLRIALLDQHREFDGATTVWDAAAEPFAHLRELERSLAEQAAALAEDPSPKAMARYDRDLERFEREGGYTYAARVDAVLQGLGFDPADARTRPLEALSGGERGRIGLARQLVSPADVYLFDEPTNHLDVETVEALEDAIDAYDGTVILVSHDRALLRALTTRVWALRDGRVEVFEGGFADWEIVQEERARARAEAEAAQEAARRERERRNAAAARREEQLAEKQRRAALREAQRRVEAVEARIAELEARVAELTGALEDPALYSTAEGSMRAYELKSQLDAAKHELDAALEEWAEAGEALEALAAR